MPPDVANVVGIRSSAPQAKKILVILLFLSGIFIDLGGFPMNFRRKSVPGLQIRLLTRVSEIPQVKKFHLQVKKKALPLTDLIHEAQSPDRPA